MSRTRWMLACTGNLLLATLLCQCGSDTTPSEPEEEMGGAGGAAGAKAAGGSGGASGNAGSGAKAGAAGTGGKAGSAANDGGADSGVECDPSLKTYNADDSKIQYSGRIDFSDAKQPVFSAAGTSVTAKFRGQSFSILFEDEFRWANTRGFYDVVVDGKIVEKIQPEETQTEYCFKASSNGEHTVSFVKRTEPNIGKTTFKGFKFGELLAPPSKPKHRIEVIGDSITCGAGVDAKDGSDECNCAVDMAKSGGTCPSDQSGWGQPYHDAYKAYGTIVGQELDAEVHNTCVSGIGLIRNYSSKYDGRPMPEVYGLLHLEEDVSSSNRWDTSKYVPEAILIGIGTNDFGPGDAPADSPRPKMAVAEFTAKFVQFINTLHGYYPQAPIFLLRSPMLGDGWPDATYKSRSDQWEAINNVVNLFAAAGTTSDAGASASDAGAPTPDAGGDARADANESSEASTSSATGDSSVDAGAEGAVAAPTPATGVTIYAVDTDQIYPGGGCGTHPDAEQQAKLAKEVIAPFVKQKMGW